MVTIRQVIMSNMSQIQKFKIGATKIGVSLDVYISMLKSGKKWCNGCKCWHRRDKFSSDGSYSDGLRYHCREFDSASRRKRYKAKKRVCGRKMVAEREGDAMQARARVRHLVRVGMIPHPNDVKCARCGDENNQHQYHHHNGYGVGHHEDVVAVCKYCHVIVDRSSVEWICEIPD